jgi:hypothetical protein
MVTLQIEQRDASTDQARQCDDLRATLAEQAQLQREAHEDVAQHISTLSSIVADLGHTVGLLAMAAYRGQQGRPTAAPTFAPPPPLTKPTSPNTGAATAPPPASAPAAPPQPVPSVSSPSPIVRPGDSAAPDAAQTTMIEARMPEVAHAFVARPPAANLEGPASNAREPPKINSAAPARGEDSVLDFASELANDDELVQDVIDPDDAPRRGGLAPVTTLVIDDLKEIMHV